MRHVLFLLVLLGLPITCPAQMYGAEYAECNENTTVGIVDCLGNATKQWDKRLNSSYQALMKRSDAQQQAPLKAAQRLWIKYRDANCGFYGAAQGSLSQVEAAECIRSMTKARTCELQSANQGEGGPGPECKPAAAARAAPASDMPAPMPAAPQSVQAAAKDARRGAEPAAPPEDMASSIHQKAHAGRASFLGLYNMSGKRKKSYHADIFAHVHFEEETGVAGGSAVFGWMEERAEVVLISYAKYLPSLTLAQSKRRLLLSAPLVDVNELPRYLMICVWETDENKVAPALVVYGERDDANLTGSDTGDHQSLTVAWEPIPKARAEKKFAAHDYCAEISRTGRSQAPLWLEG